MKIQTIKKSGYIKSRVLLTLEEIEENIKYFTLCGQVKRVEYFYILKALKLRER